MMRDISPRLVILYAVAFGGMTLYGREVCPFVCTLTPRSWMEILVFAFGGAFLLRQCLVGRVVLDAPVSAQSRRQFLLELGIFLAAGMGVTVYDMIAMGYPLGSGLLMILGFLLFGFFIGLDLSLGRELAISRAHEARGDVIDPEVRFFSLPRKFVIFAIICTVFTGVVINFVIARNLAELLTPEAMQVIQVEGRVEESLSTIRRIFVQDVTVVVLVLLGLLLNVILSYARNLRYFFDLQTTSLQAVIEGRLDRYVPVGSHDEFGLIAKRTNHMITTLRDRTEELEKTQDATIIAMAALAEARDEDTGAHLMRTQRYVRALAVELQKQPALQNILTEKVIELLFKSAPLHDIGKVGIPDAILLKPGKLTEEEFEIMKIHPVYGAKAIEAAEGRLGSNSFLRLAREVAMTHHEKWAGGGYPEGLKGEEIPLSGRLMALADVYDALISKRVYKPAFSHEKAKSILLEGKGIHFDPSVVDAFLAVEEEFIEIARVYGDDALSSSDPSSEKAL